MEQFVRTHARDLAKQHSHVCASPHLIAHRSLDTETPYPTKARPTADFMEIDVRLNEAREVVLAHDIHGSPCVFRWKLEEILEVWARDPQAPPLLIDVKEGTRDPWIIDEIARLWRLFFRADDFPVLTFTSSLLTRIYEFHQDAIHHYGPLTASHAPEEVIRLLLATQSDTLGVEVNVCTREYLDEIREGVPWPLRIYTYTVNSYEDAYGALLAGVDGIITDKIL